MVGLEDSTHPTKLRLQLTLGAAMQYITATIGAVFIFIAVVLIGLAAALYLPVELQRPVTLPLGPFSVTSNPSIFIAIAIAPLAAAHSFRSTIKRYAAKVQSTSQTDQLDPPGSST